jgi:hypothetical protein
VHIDHFIIAARWIDHSIGGSDLTPLFVLLDPQNHVESGGELSSRDLIQICWGEVVHSTVQV